MAARVLRRFVRVGGRGVHYLRAGEGPPVVLLHSAILSANAELALLHALASDHTVFAFDQPGFGDSDPLDMEKVEIADAATAIAATLVELKLPACPVYGSHTGASVAAEMARRHPERVSALVLNGVALFGAEDNQYLQSDAYTPALDIRDDGSHLFAMWVKVRDAKNWLPWNKRAPENRMPWPFPDPTGLHEVYLDRVRSGDGYRPVYRAVFRHDAGDAIAALDQPATFMAMAQDLLHAHLDLLPPLKAGQEIVRYPADGGDFLGEKARTVRKYRIKKPAPADVAFRPTPGAINRRYADLAFGQMLVRSMGETHASRPLILIHDGRASSVIFEPLMRSLSRHVAVYAPDLPDCGASDALAHGAHTITDYADVLSAAIYAMGLEGCDIYAVGAGAAVALELLGRPDFNDTTALFDAPDFFPRHFAARLASHWAPPLAPSWEGAHLNRLWLMLRDEQAFWPWFDKTHAAACAVDGPGDGIALHARVTDILRSLSTYHRLTAAALLYDWQSALLDVSPGRVVFAASADEPRLVHAQAAAKEARLAPVAILPSAMDAKAAMIMAAIGANRDSA